MALENITLQQQLLRVTDYILNNMNLGGVTDCALFFDLKKAFDTVNNDLQKLECYGILIGLYHGFLHIIGTSCMYQFCLR